MMATTHVLAGMLLGLAVAPLAPDAATPVVLAGAVGGLAPDLDAVRNHRRDLHFPVYATALALAALPVAALTRSAAGALVAAFLGAGALHAATDALGGGRSLRPWAETVDRAVFCHAQGRWWRPRRLIPYDGAPADLALAICLALPVVVLVDSPSLRWLVGGLVAVSAGYALVRRRVPDLVAHLDDRLRSRQGGRGRTRN